MAMYMKLRKFELQNHIPPTMSRIKNIVPSEFILKKIINEAISSNYNQTLMFTFSHFNSWKWELWSRGMIHISNGNVAANGTIEKKWVDSSIKSFSVWTTHRLHFPVLSKYSFVPSSRAETEGGITGRAIIWLWEWLSEAPAEAPWFLNTLKHKTKYKVSLNC